ncbi:DUF342 domain-containing protein [Bacillus sp. 1P06AnD]|uniref:DUF342 domain-containing protein n=1 Tax=Bacillus sp. 1P06AnD TaxID=3132208 RepID=UPI0039A1AD0D
MDGRFEVLKSKDGLMAKMVLKKDMEAFQDVTADELNQALAEYSITYGIQGDVLASIALDPSIAKDPIVVAEGIPPTDGEDGFLVNKVSLPSMDKANEQTSEKTLNLRNVLTIPSVKNGQCLAEIMKPGLGVPGIDVSGTAIPAKTGRAFKLKAGKNVLFLQGKVYATVDGQVSLSNHAVHVHPIFEVQGDLDLKTGNIDFIGNVVIHGDVPNGYSIRAGGDIKIDGLVESADLKAGGSIHILGGITGGNKGSIEAELNIQANYLNQANCRAGGSVYIESSILHSRIECGGSVYCKRGAVIGGFLSAMDGVEANDFGNHHYMQTSIFVGKSHQYAEQELKIQKEINLVKAALDKLKILSEKLQGHKQMTGTLGVKERLVLEKQEITTRANKEKLARLEEEAQKLKELQMAHEQAYIHARGTVYPNTEMRFGKYSKVFQKKTSSIKIFFSEGEIRTEPLS